jgi:hypothetical protein
LRPFENNYFFEKFDDSIWGFFDDAKIHNSRNQATKSKIDQEYIHSSSFESDKLNSKLTILNSFAGNISAKKADNGETTG